MLYKLYHIWYHPSKNDEFSSDKPKIFASTPAMGGSSSVQSDGDSRYRVRLVVSSIFNRGTLGCNHGKTGSVMADGNLTVDGNLKHQIFFHRIFSGIPWYEIDFNGVLMRIFPLAI